MIRADAVLADQALFNLIENALSHAGKGNITLVARRITNGVALEVQDEGPGIPPGEEARIFDRFARGGSAASNGVGLGLAIVKGFAGLMNARVFARNRPDRSGAIFSIVFSGEAA